MKVTYWVAKCLDDSDVYSIRTKTKKECLEKYNKQIQCSKYDKPKKVTVEYASGFDLLRECSIEGGMYWEG